MNYFIDFEATQFSNEIISIGCVRENGDTFYSEVRAKKKITSFITSLTGITDEQNKKADSSDDVFRAFFKWLCEYPQDRAIFYCYGNSDFNFVKKNLNLTHNLGAQAALSVIGMNLYDYSATTKAHFGLAKNISLIKLVAYYRGVESIEQAHNALEDALYLKEVFENVSIEKEVLGHPFPDYENDLPNIKDIESFLDGSKASTKSPRELLRSVKHRIDMYDCQGDVIEESFDSIQEARNYLIKKLGSIDKWKVDKNKIENKIINANRTKTQYTGHYWSIVILEDSKN